MRSSYFLPRSETDARRSKEQIARHFGEAALRTWSIRPGRRWNKVEVQATLNAHEDARSLTYLGMLDVRTETPFP